MNVLITSASRKVSLVQEFQRAVEAHAPGGGRVIAVDVNPMSPALFFADERYLVPRSDAPGFVSTLLDMCVSLGVSLLVPTRDEELPLFAAHAEEFQEAGVLVAVSPPETIEACQDKVAFRRFCESHGFSVPRTYADSEIESAAFPLFVKPRRGKGGAGASIVADRDALTEACARIAEPVAQELREEPEYTIDVFVDRGGRTVSAVPRERVFVLAGESYVGKTLKDQTLIDESVRLASELGIFGHATIQCFYDGSDVRFIEVNPRYGGAANLGFAAGAPTPHYLVEVALDREVSPRVGEFQDGLVMLRYTQDLFFGGDEMDVPPWA